MTSGQETERVYSFNPESTRCPDTGACVGLLYADDLVVRADCEEEVIGKHLEGEFGNERVEGETDGKTRLMVGGERHNTTKTVEK